MGVMMIVFPQIEPLLTKDSDLFRLLIQIESMADELAGTSTTPKDTSRSTASTVIIAKQGERLIRQRLSELLSAPSTSSKSMRRPRLPTRSATIVPMAGATKRASTSPTSSSLQGKGQIVPFPCRSREGADQWQGPSRPAHR